MDRFVNVLDREAIVNVLENVLDALRDEMPVKPRMAKSSTARRRWAYCGRCGAGLRVADNCRDAYCWRCGAEVDWNEAD